MNNTEEFLSLFKETADRIFETVKRKNGDYTERSGDSPFENFEYSADLAGVETERGILVRMGDKMMRLRSLIGNEPLVRDESFVDTAEDLAAYAIILAIYRKLNPKDVYISDYEGLDEATGGYVNPVEPVAPSKLEKFVRDFFGLQKETE